MSPEFRPDFKPFLSQYRDREGQPFEVIGPVPQDERHEEVGMMWEIRFQDGVVIAAWPEEVELGLAASKNKEVGA
jgi:hypothetical protein